MVPSLPQVGVFESSPVRGRHAGSGAAELSPGWSWGPVPVLEVWLSHVTQRCLLLLLLLFSSTCLLCVLLIYLCSLTFLLLFLFPVNHHGPWQTQPQAGDNQGTDVHTVSYFISFISALVKVNPAKDKNKTCLNICIICQYVIYFIITH